MSETRKQDVMERLAQTLVPELGAMALVDLCEVEVAGEAVSVLVRSGVHNRQLEAALTNAIQTALADSTVTVKFAVTVGAGKSLQQARVSSVPGVRNIIAVASGKGGVGKSTTAVNLALALASEGASVGMLDADIYGPSQPHMLGVGDKRPEMYGPNMIEPIDALGLKVVSMGNLVTENTPVVWRGPMVSGALQQLLNNTHWQDIDYLVIDMPPGTGDVQLTLSQAVPVSGAVIVTTPQDIALLDARKGIEMFRKVQIPVLGVVENMSTHVCSNCGHTEAIFGEHGGDRLAEDYGIGVLGRLPLTMAIREQTDAGRPPVASDPDSDVAREYLNIARAVAMQLWQQSASGQSGPVISIADD